MQLAVRDRPILSRLVPFPDDRDLIAPALEMAIEGIGDHAGGLQPGQMVITGTLTGIEMFDESTQVQAEISGLGNVAFELSKA